ncbi:MAG TPA: hypothetical protein VFI29_19030 [Hanamia sp.]|nr:hypothetical protein [Hanamia sp.]
MQSEHYRESLEDALKNLFEINGRIYDSLIPIAMTGELNEWNDPVPIGETHNFDFELFKNCSDTNIQLLVKLIEKVDETYQTIKNVNAIETKEDGEEE